MIENGSLRLGTPYHEAGHGVVAYLLGARIARIDLAGDSNKEGLTPLGKPDPTPCIQIMVGMAGPLAEAKFLASSYWASEVSFDLNDTMAIGLLRNPNLIKHTLMVRFINEVSDSTPYEVKDGNVFSDFEEPKMKDLAAAFDDGELERMLRQIKGLLDEKCNWTAVGALAQALLKEGTLSGATAEEIIRCSVGI